MKFRIGLIVFIVMVGFVITTTYARDNAVTHSMNNPYKQIYMKSIIAMQQSDQSFDDLTLAQGIEEAPIMAVTSKTCSSSCSKTCSDSCSKSCTTTKGCSSNCKKKTEGCEGSSGSSNNNDSTVLIIILAAALSAILIVIATHRPTN